MSDLFLSYAAEKAPRDTVRDWDNQRQGTAHQRKMNGGVKALSQLETRMREKQRLSKSYMRWRRQATKELLASEPRLSTFLRYLRTVTAETGHELLEALAACEWLLDAPETVRIFALRMIDARANKINQSLGNDILDDPIPPHTSIYFQAKAILYTGGR